ncbi:MAG: Flp pilus assembly complex ATPase component TadA [Phycisphaerales bacterium]|nr:Flp pilus assembly complex ATPase component TadA [Phycisphaerales bacterium]
MSRLRLRQTESDARPFRLGPDPITIGRHPSNTIPISDEKASRKHCVVESDGAGGYRVRDLGSRNGIKINGFGVQESPVVPGDVITIGKTEFMIEEAIGDAGDPNEETAAGTHRAAKPEPDWAGELSRVLVGLPPRDAPPPEVRMVFADGSPSEVLAGSGDGATAVRVLLQTASKSRATDIHIEPKAEVVQVRMRVDGQMVWIADLPKRVGELVGGLIRTACQLQSAASDAVLDGHFSARFPDRRVEYRASFTPTMQGSKLVVRVLDERGIPHSIGELGLANYMEERVRKTCGQSQGMLLVCGPTGSGKTTTLYNCLRAVDREKKNVITIEDPVEYQIDGCTQIPINEKRGNTFYSLLRSCLRQDPDVILLGEVRDDETARTAMQAAMTGHLVFSTLHAKDTISAVYRLLDLKVEPYLVANALELILAQRLVRVLCEQCKRVVSVSPGQATRIGRFLGGKSEVYAPVGCQACLKTGFRGRQALFELLEFNDDLRDVILTDQSIHGMRKVIEAGLFTTLTQSGWKLAAEGLTSLEEVDRVSGG